MRATLAGVREVLAERRLPFILVRGFVANPVPMSVLALWAGPYLHDVHGLAGVARGNVLLVMAAAMIAGTLVYDPLDRLFDTRERVVVGAALANAMVLAALPLIGYSRIADARPSGGLPAHDEQADGARDS